MKVATPLAFVGLEPVPLAVFAPVTENRTVTPGTGRPAKSRTVAVTVCGLPTVFMAVAGVSVIVYGAPIMSSFVTNASWPPLAVLSYAPTVVGKSDEAVRPVT